jgi:hypothetical protein
MAEFFVNMKGLYMGSRLNSGGMWILGQDYNTLIFTALCLYQPLKVYLSTTYRLDSRESLILQDQALPAIVQFLSKRVPASPVEGVACGTLQFAQI